MLPSYRSARALAHDGSVGKAATRVLVKDGASGGSADSDAC